MKKISLCVIMLLIISMLAVPALAAQSATMSVSASSGTVYRGDTITVTVSTSKVDNATSGGFMFSYDKNVFEYVNGSAGSTLGGYTSGISTAAGNVAGFFMNGNATIQGSIFQITLKVKDSAAFGTYSISGTPNITAGDGAVSCGAGSANVTVACQHSYGSWAKVSSTQHKRTCSVCLGDETVNHTWNSGTITKQPDCKESGTKTFTCTGCNATKTEDVAKTTNHNYGSWTKVSDTQHKHICSVCQKEETASHGWNGGATIKQANCKEGGQFNYTCTACSATKTEDTPRTNTHSYGKWVKVNDTTHKHTCSVCSKEETANHSWNSGTVTKKATCKEAGVRTYTCTGCSTTKTEAIAKLTTHTYDHACDADCNVCGATRTITHNYKTSWSKSKTEHWHECTICKEKKDAAAHTPGAEATEKRAQTCTVCDYIIKPALGHKHDYATKWTTDDKGHWYTCAGCVDKGSYAEHDFENACDPDCSICGYTRETKHTYEEKWISDETNHWHVCTGCGLKTDDAAHEPGAEATTTTAQTCTICGYEIASALGGETTEPTDATESTTPVVQDPPVKGSFPWWIVVVVVSVTAGVIAAFVIFKKKEV